MDKKIQLSTRGQLNTYDPTSSSEHPPGTLTESKDLSDDAWGARTGSGAFSRAWESPGVASLYDEITLGTAGTTRGLGTCIDPQFADLGTKFTLDIWFRILDTAHASAQQAIGIYGLSVGGNVTFDVFLRGPAHATEAGRIRVETQTAATRSTQDSLVGFTGTASLSPGSTQVHKQHIRVVRDGTTATLYLNGVQDGQTTGLSAVNGLIGDLSLGTQVQLGTSNAAGGNYFNGQIFGCVLRDGAYSSLPIEAVMPCDPWARNVHHYYLGRSIALGGDVHFFDAGRFSNHARVVGADYTLAASNDNAAPVPAPVQGMKTWTTRNNRTAMTVICGGQSCSSVLS